VCSEQRCGGREVQDAFHMGIKAETVHAAGAGGCCAHKSAGAHDLLHVGA
jgi:hypothetical protein